MSLQEWERFAGIASPWIGFATAIVLALSTIIAFKGLSTWRKQRDAELCEDVLTKFYQAQSAFRWMRCIFTSTAEHAESQNSEEDAIPQQESSWIQNELWNRYNQHAETFASLQALRFRFQARFGREADEPFRELRELCDKIFDAAHTQAHFSAELASLSEKEQRRPLSESDQRSRSVYQSNIKKAETVIWGVGDTDAIHKRLSDIIGKIEERCRKHIGR